MTLRTTHSQQIQNRMVHPETHSRFLDYIVENPEFIGEQGHLDWCLREGLWKLSRHRFAKMPDLIMQFGHRYVICELKHCYERRFEAMDQIQSGADFLTIAMHTYCKPVGKIAYYSETQDTIQFEEVPVKYGLSNILRRHQ